MFLNTSRLEGLKRSEDEDCVVACGPLSFLVIPSQFWRLVVFNSVIPGRFGRLVVFQFCFVNFVAAKWD